MHGVQEWRDWRDNPACDHYDFVKVLGGGAYAEVSAIAAALPGHFADCIISLQTTTELQLVHSVRCSCWLDTVVHPGTAHCTRRALEVSLSLL